MERQLDDDKARDVIVIDLTGKSSLIDYMVIASGTSQRHLGAMAQHLREKLKQIGRRAVAVEGERQLDWVLIDSGDVVIHLFRPEVRDFYDLEKMWGVSRPPMREAAGLGASAAM